MGILLLRGRTNDENSLSDRQDTTADTDRPAQPANDNPGPLIDPWMIVVIVIGALVFVSLISVMAICHVRSRRRKLEVKQADPISHEYSRRRKMNTSDRLQADELERAIMIRKSLASRTSNRHSQNSSILPADGHRCFMEMVPDEVAEKASLREDWRDREAGLQPPVQIEREIPRTPDADATAVDAGTREPHPVFFNPPRLPVPTASRSPSPVRSVMAPRKNTPPPKFFFTPLQ